MFIRSILLVSVASVAIMSGQKTAYAFSPDKADSQIPAPIPVEAQTKSDIPAPIPTDHVETVKQAETMIQAETSIPAPIPKEVHNIEPSPIQRIVTAKYGIPAPAPVNFQSQVKKKIAAPVMTMSLRKARAAEIVPENYVPAPIPANAEPVQPAKPAFVYKRNTAPKTTASMPSPQPVDQVQADIAPIAPLTVQPAPVLAEENVGRRGSNPISSIFTGRTYKFGRSVISSRSRSKTQNIIVEDDMSSDHYQLDTGDRIRISVFEQRNLSRIYSIDAGGFISIPLIGNIFVRGETTRTVEEKIAAKLSEKYIREPKVSVEINRYRPFYILGQVRNSGSFPFVHGMTIRSAVAVAGGFTARANKTKILLTRRVNAKRITLTVPSSYSLRPGDTLEIRERFF